MAENEKNNKDNLNLSRRDDRANKAIDDSLASLNLGYIDLMLIHQPGANDEEEMREMANLNRQERFENW